MAPDTEMTKYLFKAQAVALRGSIRKPYFQELGDHLAIGTYAGSRMRAECTNRDFAVGEDVKYKFARTEIVTSEKDGVYESTLIARVEGLKVGKVEVDEVTCRLQSRFDKRQYPGNCFPRILPVGSTIENLRIDGKRQELHLPDAFKADQETTSAFFLDDREENKKLGPGRIPEPLFVKGIGTVYYAEWTWAHPGEYHQQRLTMLRLALGSDNGAAIDVCAGNSDGFGWPPTGN